MHCLEIRLGNLEFQRLGKIRRVLEASLLCRDEGYVSNGQCCSQPFTKGPLPKLTLLQIKNDLLLLFQLYLPLSQKAFATEETGENAKEQQALLLKSKPDLVTGSIKYEMENYIYFFLNLQPGCVNTTEVDIKKSSRMRNPHKTRKVGSAFQ